MRPVYPKSYGLDPDLQEDKQRFKRHTKVVIKIMIPLHHDVKNKYEYK